MAAPSRCMKDPPSLQELQSMTYSLGGKVIDFRLMDRIKPRLKDVAIALHFASHEIDAIVQSGDTATQVYNLLCNWLRGELGESRPSVSWGTLITALKRAGLTEEAAILEEHCVSKTSPDLVRDAEGYKAVHGPVKVFVKPDVPETLLSLMESYSDMLQVLRKTKLPNDKFCALKSYLADFCEEKAFRQCSKMDDVIDLLKEELKIFYFNVDVLTCSCKHFCSSKVDVSLRCYKKQLKLFFQTTTVKEFKDTLETKITDSSKVESVTLKLDENKACVTLNALKRLVYYFIGNAEKMLIHHEIRTGCVCVSWVVHSSLVSIVREKVARLSPEHLASEGVLEIVVGLRIVPNEGLNAGFLTTAVQSYYNIDWTDDDALSIVSGESGYFSAHSESAVPVVKIRHQGVLIREPPSSDQLEKMSRLFTICLFVDRQCKYGLRCPFPHSEEELDYWNDALRDFKYQQKGDTHQLRTQKMQQALTTPLLLPIPLQPQSHPSTRQQQPLSQPPSPYPSHDAPLIKDKRQTPLQPQGEVTLTDSRDIASLPLTRKNYRKKFSALLYLEEAVHDEVLKNKCNGEYQLHVKALDSAPSGLRHRVVEHVRYASIRGMSSDQMMYAALASECVYICDPENEEKVSKADILLGFNFSKISDKLFVAFNLREASNLESCFQIGDDCKNFSIIAKFEVKHSYFHLLRRSLASISDDTIDRIMPEGELVHGLNLSRVPFPKEYESLPLDKKQFQALQFILFSRSRAPVIILGSFGTGKTRLLAVATLSFIETAMYSDNIARVLVCCHHQVSADTFIDNFFRGVSSDRNDQWNVELVRLTSNVYYLVGSEYDYLYVPLHVFQQRVNDGRYAKIKRLVVVTTYSTALNIARLLGTHFFTHILLDEAAQVREPEAVAPLCMANRNTKIIITGDPQQVGPALLVLGDMPQQFGLGVSLLERLLKANYHIAHLSTNYHCHRDILELPSQLFYGSSLFPMFSAFTVPDAPYPLFFLCSSISDPRPIINDSNEYEAMLLVEQFQHFSRKGDTRSFRLGTCFMALSRRQVTLLKHYLNKFETRAVKILPSYEIQGHEFKALFISTVESIQDDYKSSNPTKSFCNRYVFNTALTRAQSLVVVAGNPFQLLKVESTMNDPVGCWEEYLRRCITHGTLIVPSRVGNSDNVLDRLKQLIMKDDSRPHDARIVPKQLIFKDDTRSHDARIVHVPIDKGDLRPRLQDASSDFSHYTHGDEERSHSERIFAKHLASTIHASVKQDSLHHSQHPYHSRDIELLEAELTVENYKKKFHQLLCREEDEHERILIERCNNEYSLTMYQHRAQSPAKKTGIVDHVNRYGYISADHLDREKLAYIEQTCEKDLVIVFNGKSYHATLITPYYHSKRPNLFIEMSKQDAYQLKKLKCLFSVRVEVKFTIKYSYFDRLHMAIDLLSLSTIRRLCKCSFSKPLSSPTLFLPIRYSQLLSLDYSQRKVLNMIVYGEPKSPILVTGSAGTGKTRILALAAFQIFTVRNTRRPRVLLCTHHRKSANLFLTEYFGPMKEHQGWKVRIARMMQIKEIDEIEACYRPYCKTVSQVAGHLSKIELVISTFGLTLHLAQLLQLNGSLNDWFTHILIDEGALTREPETIAPLSMCGPNTVIAIVGDHKQIGPATLVIGNDPLKYGLGQSLLERLCSMYGSHPSTADTEKCCATLVENYHCHPSLLSLVSYLFYQSTLTTNMVAQKQALVLHPNTTYPLYFVCSSLDDSIVEVVDSTNHQEALLLVQAAAKYVKDWPPEWGRKNLSSVCIVATTANQQSILHDIARKYHNIFNGDDTSVQIRRSTDIQGLEFQCVFLSTAEPTSSDGEPIYPTKSPCNQYVFNTVLIRAKSLVVCSGNPFLLMKKEAKIGNKDGPCWSEYIRRCFENETLIVPQSLWSNEQDRRNKIGKLTELVFRSNSLNVGTFFTKSQPRKSVSLKGNTLLCYLEIVSNRNALGHPLDSTQSIFINGRTNWRGAFDNDLVVVELFDKAERFGKVIKIVKSGHKERYVCRMGKHSTLHFYPINKKVPCFTNLPKFSRGLLKIHKKDIEDGLVHQMQFVVVFEENSLHGEDKLPRIKEIVSAELAYNLLFIVRVIGWEPDFSLPIGAVVESLPLGTNFFHSERILRAEHNIYKDDLDRDDLNQSDPFKMTESLPSSHVMCQAFTIDSSDARILDNALSLVYNNKNMYTMAVCVSNVSQLRLDSDIDKRALSRATSVYGSGMIPAAFCQKFSLNPKQICDVIVVSTKITLQKDGSVSIDTADTSIREGKLMSQVRLNYVEAQCLLSKRSMPGLQVKADQFSRLPGQPDLALSLQLLYKIAMHLRAKRLGRAAYSYNHHDEIMDSWQAHLLVEELMIWVNSTVAEYVYKHMPNYAVLRRQSGPNDHDLMELQRLYGHVIGHSVAMSSLANSRSTLQPLMIPYSTLIQIQEAIESKNAFQLQCLLTSDSFYPQLAAAADYLMTVSQKANYESSYRLSQKATTTSPFRHHSLCCDYYTHFNSPLQRYCDVVVQRLLLSILNQSECPYTLEELGDLCQHLNGRSQETKQFEKELSKVEFAQQLGETCEETHVYAHRNMSSLKFSFPEVKYKSCLDRQKTEFHISTLLCHVDDKDVLRWTGNMFSFNGNDSILDNCRICQVEVLSSEKIVSTTPHITMTVLYNPVDQASLEATEKEQSLSTEAEEQCKLLKLQVYLLQTQKTVAIIDPHDWQRVIQKVDSNSSDENFYQVSAVISKAQSQKLDKDGRTFEHTTMLRFRKSPTVRYTVRCKLGSNSIFSVWLGQNYCLKEPILSSCLQLIEVAPELRICLQHNKHPAECFSDTSLSQASKSQYKSLEEYVILWKKVHLAEAAQDSILASDKVNVLKDVRLQWPDLYIPTSSTEEFYLPRAPLTLVIPPENQSFLHYDMNISPGDLVCVRYDVKKEQCKAVYHLVVKEVYVDRVKKIDMGGGDKNPIIIKFESFGKYSCRISSKMASILRRKQPTCELQVTNLRESYSCIYKMLVSLGDLKMRHRADEFVSYVAMGDILSIKKQKSPFAANALAVLRTDTIAHTLWTHDTRLNVAQIKAMQLAITNCFQLIQGPPGSGKSVIGTHIAYIFAQVLKANHSDQCVVFCAPSNKAVDVIHENLLMLKSKGRDLKLLRLYNNLHEKADFPADCVSQDYLLPGTRCSPKFRQHALHYLIRENCPELVHMEERFQKMALEDTVPTLEMLFRHKKLIEKREEMILEGNYDIILTTCNECAGKRLLKLRDYERVAHVIIDECGMAFEPETIAAINLSNHVVMIGDHKQLQPVVKYTPARENGLGTSLFERYAENFEHECLFTLEVQYRMHEKICKFPSDHFYSGILKADDSILKRPLVKALNDFWPAGIRSPILFCDVVEEESSSTLEFHSRYNTGEARKVVDIVQALQKRIEDHSVTVAIITPYRAQKYLVMNKMPVMNVPVLTINECQGDEYDYVILNTVRSLPLSEIKDQHLVQADRQWLVDNLGFVTDEHQINVAITRAKQGLIIVGNRTLLEYDASLWKPLIDFYSSNNCIVNGSMFPR